MSVRNRNEAWARTFVDELVREGLRHVVIAPGSRSAPLVLAASERPELRIHPVLDERSAAFFALGIGRAAGSPAAVLTTSGTAVANLFPAVVESSASEIPLLLLTADRPPHLRGADANQTIDQLHIFGGYVRAFLDLPVPDISDRGLRHLRALAGRSWAASLGAPAGPVHVNAPFAKPLEPTPVAGDIPADLDGEGELAMKGREGGAPFTRVRSRLARASDQEVDEVAGLLRGARRPLIVAGPSPRPGRTGPVLLEAARASGAVLLADPLSGARGPAPGRVCRPLHYDLYLRDPTIRRDLDPDLVLRVGRSPTSGALLDYLREAREARQVVVDGGASWKDHLSVASDYFQADPEDFLARLAERGADTGFGGRDPSGPGEWGTDEGPWAALDRAAALAVEEELTEGEFFEGTVLRDVVRSLPAGEALFVSGSMPIRDLDAFGGVSGPGTGMYGNRGASGVDGILSSALGLSMGRKGGVVAVVGDVAFHHDMNGLLAAREEGARVVFVLIHNDGGGIFHMLPIRRHEPAFTPFFATPHGLDFRHAAELYTLPYRRVEGRSGLSVGTEGQGSTREAFQAALEWALEAGESVVLEVTTDREENRRRHEETAARVTEVARRELERTYGR